MSTDRWAMKIECPQCGKTSEAEAIEADGAVYFRDKRTYIGRGGVFGFRVVRSLLKTTVHCDDCHLVVWEDGD